MTPGKILSISIKLLIGVGSFIFIYSRLKHEFTPEKLDLLRGSILSAKGFWCTLGSLVLIPVNWGLESYKWQLITAPVQSLSYRKASESVYSGVCLGNLAPGRATEFVAKILFFDPENRSRITVLHFVNGMFQLSMTILFGLLALLVRLKDLGEEQVWVLYLTSGIGIGLLILLVFCIARMDSVLRVVTKRISKQTSTEAFHYRFTSTLLTQLFGYSFLRYAVFFTQFVLLMLVFENFGITVQLLASVAIYFLITTTLPMISVLEAAIRAAVALLVFKGCGLSNTTLAMSSVMIWLVNIILPSIAGYVFLVRQNFNFKFMSRKHAG